MAASEYIFKGRIYIHIYKKITYWLVDNTIYTEKEDIETLSRVTRTKKWSSSNKAVWRK